jgi:exonuclease SbcD
MLYEKKRYDEHEAFLNWFIEQIDERAADLIIIAGDIFDTTTPSHRAQELYYQFLYRVGKTRCRHVVIIGGNHDSPTLLDAPRELLRLMNIYVVGSARETLADEVIILRDEEGKPQCIVCAVPYLRDRDVRVSEAGEGYEEKDENRTKGIRDHYRGVCDYAERIRTDSGLSIPVLATGHLFTAGARTVEGDGVRELYIGSLSHVSEAIFPESIDYLALGHLHIPQKVDGKNHRRFSGSPVPMGFGEADQSKHILCIRFEGRVPEVSEIEVPVFQSIKRLSGDLDMLKKELETLKNLRTSVWVEVSYEGTESGGTVSRILDECVTASQVEILRKKNLTIVERTLSHEEKIETLDELSVEQVFEKCLEAYEVAPDRIPGLLLAYHEIVNTVEQTDISSE